MIRIGFYTECYVVGGAERYLLDIITGLNPGRYEIILFSNPNSAFLRYVKQRGMGRFPHKVISILPANPFKSLKITRRAGQAKPVLPKPPSTSWQSFRTIAKSLWHYARAIPNLAMLVKAFRSQRLDILHISNGGYPAAETCRLAVLAAHIVKIPACVMTVHGPAAAFVWPRTLERAFDSMVVKRLGKIITLSVSTARSLHNIRGVPDQLMRPMDLGIDLALPTTSTLSTDEVRTQLDIPQSAIVVGLVGRFDWYKGHRYLLEAARIVMDSGQGSDLYLLLVGDGDELLPMKSLACTLGIANRTVFTGFYPDAIAAVRACDIMTMLSVGCEGQGYVNLEAMAQGKPVIATNVGGIAEVVVHGKTGLLVPPADSGELANAIRRLIADRRLRETMGKEGRCRVESLFGLERMLAETQSVYEELLSE